MPQLTVFAHGFVQIKFIPPNSNPVTHCRCSIKCAAGSKSGEATALEVGGPLLGNGDPYPGAWNQHEFAAGITKYLDAGMQQVFGFAPGSTAFMQQNFMGFPGRIIINVPGTPPLAGIW
jgi:hypothetical protein